jgi:hypothetical protein
MLIKALPRPTAAIIYESLRCPAKTRFTISYAIIRKLLKTDGSINDNIDFALFKSIFIN